MTKPFKPVTNQVELLKTRGLSFDNEAEAQLYLLKYNYYNVINCYSKFFEDSCDHYIPGAKFNEIIATHNFDLEIKNTLFKNVILFETYFKSILAYTFSENTQGIKNPYLDQRFYDQDNMMQTLKIIMDLSKLINFEQKKQDNAISHYVKKHKEIPLWVLVNFMTFGQAVTLYKSCNKSIKHKITFALNTYINHNLGISDLRMTDKQLELVLSNIKDIRNILAHDNMLCNFQSRDNRPYIPCIFNPKSDKKKEERKTLYFHIRILHLLLSHDQYQTMIDSLKHHVKYLSKNITTIDCCLITSSLGLPDNWSKIDEKNNLFNDSEPGS